MLLLDLLVTLADLLLQVGARHGRVGKIALRMVRACCVERNIFSNQVCRSLFAVLSRIVTALILVRWHTSLATHILELRHVWLTGFCEKLWLVSFSVVILIVSILGYFLRFFEQGINHLLHCASRALLLTACFPHGATFHLHLATTLSKLTTALRHDLRIFALIIVILLCKREAVPNRRFFATTFLAHFSYFYSNRLRW